jgi:hypothetical protein
MELHAGAESSFQTATGSAPAVCAPMSILSASPNAQTFVRWKIRDRVGSTSALSALKVTRLRLAPRGRAFELRDQILGMTGFCEAVDVGNWAYLIPRRHLPGTFCSVVQKIKLGSSLFVPLTLFLESTWPRGSRMVLTMGRTVTYRTRNLAKADT